MRRTALQADGEALGERLQRLAQRAVAIAASVEQRLDLARSGAERRATAPSP